MKKIGFALLGVSALTVTGAALGTASGVIAQSNVSNGTWVHYAYKEATESSKGVREYWIQCGTGTYQFTAPEGVAPVDATSYDTTGFTDTDPRWVNYTGETVFYNLTTSSYDYREASSDTAEYTTLVGDLPTAYGTEAYRVFTKSDSEPAIQVDLLAITGVITTADEFVTATDASTNSVSGYYILGNDLGAVTTTSGGSHTNTTGVDLTIDGRGYSVTSLKAASSTGGILGTCGSGSTYHFTLKNISINSFTRTTYGMMGYMPANNTNQSLLFDNVYLKIGEAYTNGFICATGIKTQMTFKDCTFDYNGKQNTYMIYSASSVYPNFVNTRIALDSSDTTQCIIKGQASTERDGYTSNIDGVTFAEKAYSKDYAANASNFSLAVPFTGSSQSGYQMWTRKFVTTEVGGDTSDKIMCQTGTYVPNYGGFKVLFNNPIKVTELTKYIHIRAYIYIENYDGTATSMNFRGYKTNTPTINDYGSDYRPENITVNYNAWTDCYLTAASYAIDGVLNGFVLCSEAPGLSSYTSAVYLSTITIESAK